MGSVYQEAASHFKDQLARLAPVLLSALGEHGPLHHLAQCSDGVLDFLLTLETAPLATPVSEPHTTLRRIDQQLSFAVAQLDRRLSEARSGSLIRVLLEAGDGAYYCDSVIPGIYLVAARFLEPVGTEPDRVERGDRELAKLATELRRRLGLPSLNPGGFETGPPSWPAGSVSPDELHVSGDQADPRLPPCRDALAAESVHYLAYCRHGEVVFSVDMLAHDQLAHHFSLIDVTARRRLYRELVAEIGAVAGGFGKVVHPTLLGPLRRIVLDVEQGAFSYVRIKRGEYLVGVNLVQRQVERSDAATRRVAEIIRNIPAGGAVPS